MCSEEEEYRWQLDQEEWEALNRSVDVLRSEVEDLQVLAKRLEKHEEAMREAMAATGTGTLHHRILRDALSRTDGEAR